jgi:parallel beta-helix repeat protein
MANYYKVTFALILFSFILLNIFDPLFQPVKAVEKIIVVPQDYSTISSALANADVGDTILVKKGSYNENIVIDKPILLEGEDKASTFIDGDGKGSVVWINADCVVIRGFTIQNSGNNFTESGIYLNYSIGSSVSDNLVVNNNIGIYMLESGQSYLQKNNLSSNRFNFGVFSSNLDGYIQNIDASNLVDGKPMVYWVNQSGKQTPTNAGYIAAINCSDITISGASLEKNWQNLLFAYSINSSITNITSTLGEDSIWLIGSSNCTVEGNNISDNIWGGLAFVDSSNCTVAGNILSGNGGYGLFLSDSSNNNFYHNNFVNNPRQAWLYGQNSNCWDNGYPSGGNYWNNFTDGDVKSGVGQNISGSDGIGDKPYVMDSNNVDNYPLMKSWGNGSSEIILIPFEFSLMAVIVIVSFVVIIAIYFIKVICGFKRKRVK